MKFESGIHRRRLLWRILTFYIVSSAFILFILVWYAGVQHYNYLVHLDDLAPHTIQKAVTALRARVACVGLVLITLSALGGGLAWIPLDRHLRRIRRSVEEYAHGNFGLRMPSSRFSEIGMLADTLNWMAGQLEDRVSAEVRRRNEQEAVLASMVEGVIAVDTEQRIININRAAVTLLGLASRDVQGKAILEVVRNPDLQRFIHTTLASRKTTEGDLVLHGREEKFIQATGSALTDSDGNQIGALIVLNDVTRLRRLENMRQEFVANVSHELKTPITSIKGFMETLQDGALEQPEEARRFLDIIARQADRLDAIIEDLLSLSRIEQESERGEITHKAGRVSEILHGAVLACSTKAEAREINVKQECSPQLQARMNAPLLEQAVINLLDNAIKYSEPGKNVQVSAHEEDGRIAIVVRDEGPGISKEHQDRIFERFYRVDKSRSRQLGGTGLGLSIVKHIVQAHSGKIMVTSEPGKGSVFTLLIPR